MNDYCVKLGKVRLSVCYVRLCRSQPGGPACVVVVASEVSAAPAAPCTYVCVYGSVCVPTCTFRRWFLFACGCTRVWVCVRVYVYVYMCECNHVRMCV